MSKGYPGHLDALIRSKFGNQSYICLAEPKNGQNVDLTAILYVTMLFWLFFWAQDYFLMEANA